MAHCVEGSRWRAAAETAYLMALALWLGSLVMSGVSAAIVFPTMKELDPRLPEYAAYGGDHWLIAGGHVAARVFRACDLVQVGAAAVALASLGLVILRGGTGLTRPLMIARAVSLVCAVGVLGYAVLVFTPGFREKMRAYWDAARAGQDVAAARHKASLDAAHPPATRLVGASTLCVLAALGTGAWAAATHGTDGEAEESGR